MNVQLKKSIWISYLIGAPIGVFVVFLTIILPFLITGKGLFTLGFLGSYGFATLGLIISFFIALFFGGKIAYESVKKGDSINKTSFKYSLSVNIIIWATFCLVLIIQFINEFSVVYFMLIPAVIGFCISVIVSIFTIGLLISWMIRRNIVKIQYKKHQIK